jgi:hypothetical protein
VIANRRNKNGAKCPFHLVRFVILNLRGLEKINLLQRARFRRALCLFEEVLTTGHRVAQRRMQSLSGINSDMGIGAMTRKKAKTGKVAVKKSAPKKKTTRAKKQSDPAQVREQLAGIVKSKAKGITKAVMDHAMHGELAPAKYLLEMAGVYPATSDDGQTTQEEDCLAKTLLDRLNVPHERPANSPQEEPEDADTPVSDEAEKRAENAQDGGCAAVKDEGESVSD